MVDCLLVDYFDRWVCTYKRGAVRDVTLKKYQNDLTQLKKIVPLAKMSDVDRVFYQDLLNKYAVDHEKTTTMDFHHHLKSCLLDAVDDGLVKSDPTRRAVVKGKPPREKKAKYLSRRELDELLRVLQLSTEVNFDWMILLMAKTGLRFSEALALTPSDFNFRQLKLRINKTWNYKNGGGFDLTKNKSSVRTIQIDWQTAMQFSQLCEGKDAEKPLFVKPGDDVYNSTVNGILARRCKEAGVPVIGVHGLRHTHASVLLSNGVSVASVSQRLGHSNIATTQKVYLHVIKELEDKDTSLVMMSMTGLGG